MTRRTWVTAAAVAAMVGLGRGHVKADPPPKGIALRPLGSFESGFFNEGAVEISAFDHATARVFVTYADRPYVGIIDISNPDNPVPASPVSQIPLPLGGRATSVAVHDGVVAVAIPLGEDDTAPGRVAFFSTSGDPLSVVTVGSLPDMVTFTPNGQYVLTANEGQPNDDYDIDPEGSVSMIDVRNGAAAVTQADVTTIGFTAFNSVPLDPSIRIFGPGATVAEDLEPEYIAVSHDSKTAWVTLQENNAIATIDLRAKKVTSIKGLGFKDHSQPGKGLDGNREDGRALIQNWPILGVYMPDAIATLRVGSKTYLVTANEGDAREYDGLNGEGSEIVDLEDVVLDPDVFSEADAAALQDPDTGLGKLKVTIYGSNLDQDDELERVLAFGARSFSIWSTDITQVFDSGQQLEDITAAAYPDNFNANSTNNEIDGRSDDKGPEPEGITVASVFGRTYIFVMLERIGGVMVYEATNPAAPTFVTYVSTRDITVEDPEDPEPGEAPGDLGPEAARFVPADESPNGRPLLIVSNEVSGSLRVFEIEKTTK